MSLDAVIFIISSVVAVFGATMMISVKSPIASVLYLILSIVAQAVCYIQLGGLFLASILVIVYAGAIMVLFLFVIMLLNLRGSEDLGPTVSPVSNLTKYLVSSLIALELIFVVKEVFLPPAATGVMAEPIGSFGSVNEVGMLMFTKFLYPFELTGVLLLIAVVGAVVIARKDDPGDISQPQPAAVSVPKPQQEVRV